MSILRIISRQSDPYLFSRSARLFALPSFLGGMASALDLGTTLKEYNESITPQEADIASIRSDWFSVGDDLSQAIISYRKEAEATHGSLH